MIIEQLRAKYPSFKKFGDAFGKPKQTAHDWTKRNEIPDEHWDRITELLPGTTIEDCYAEFVRSKRKKDAA